MFKRKFTPSKQISTESFGKTKKISVLKKSQHGDESRVIRLDDTPTHGTYSDGLIGPLNVDMNLQEGDRLNRNPPAKSIKTKLDKTKKGRSAARFLSTDSVVIQPKYNSKNLGRKIKSMKGLRKQFTAQTQGMYHVLSNPSTIYMKQPIIDHDANQGSMNQPIIDYDANQGSMNQPIIDYDANQGSMNQPIIDYNASQGSMNRPYIDYNIDHLNDNNDIICSSNLPYVDNKIQHLYN